MQVQFELQIGQNKFTLIEEVANNKEFFQKLHFYSTLPKVGPNGEDDLVVQFRVAQEKYEYYSLVSEKAGQEYTFGQPKKNDGSLYGKGWQPIFKGENSEQDDTQEQTHVAPGQSVGLGAPAPQQLQAPPAQTPKPAAPPASKPVNKPAAPVTPANNGATPQAKSVLAKFGI